MCVRIAVCVLAFHRHASDPLPVKASLPSLNICSRARARVCVHVCVFVCVCGCVCAYPQAKLKTPGQLQELLDITRELLQVRPLLQHTQTQQTKAMTTYVGQG